MKKLFGLLALLLCGIPAFGQSLTRVTGVITDPNSVAYYPARVQACLTTTGVQPTATGITLTPYPKLNSALQTNYCAAPVTTDSSGAFSMLLVANSGVTPSGSQYTFTVQTTGTQPPAGKGSQTFTSAEVTVTGSTQDVSTSIKSVGPSQLNSSGDFASPMTTLGDLIAEDATPTPVRLPGPTTPNGVPQYLTDTPSGGLAAAEQWALLGVLPNAQTGTSYTIAATDRFSYVTFSNVGAIAVTLPNAASAGFGSNFSFVGCDIGAGTATITPTVSNISYTTGSAYVSAASSMPLTTGQCAVFYSDNTNYFAIVRGATVYPIGVSGTVTSGGIPYFNSTAQSSSSGILNTNILVKGGGAGGAPTNSSITDNGTTISTTEAIATTSSVSSGSSPPACTAGTSGGTCYTEGTDLTNVSGAAGIDANITQHEFVGFTNGSTNQGLMVRTQPGRIHSTGNTAAITTATLCASAAGACNTAGLYTVDWAFTQGGTACGTPGAGGVTFLLTWTDANGTAHSAISLAMDDSASLIATNGTFTFRTTNAAAWASGSFNIYTNGSIIQYATGYTACGVGTGTYNLDITVTRKGQT